MSDGRRNSVDVPLSKTLVALKRVRSLRDPATNSTSKFTARMDNINRETPSSNGALLEIAKSENRDLVLSNNYTFPGDKEDCASNSEVEHKPRVANPKSSYTRKSCVVKVRGLKPPRSRLAHDSSRDWPRKSVDAKGRPKSVNLSEEEVDIYNDLYLQVGEIDQKANCFNMRKPPRTPRDTNVSCIGSPCMSMNEARTVCSSRSTLGLGGDEVDIADSIYSGCGLSYCWSRTPKYRSSNLSSDNEDQEHPLLSTEQRGISSLQASPYTEAPRSLSQKYRPKSFNDLVGQNVVAQSLMNAVSKGKVAPMYLFHGPRGTGKTSTARIFAAALNCLSFERLGPCGFCQKCVLLFSGRNRDVKELDAAKLNRKDRIKAVSKSASLAPSSSRFKVFIIDDCECLHGETWDSILNSLDEVSGHAVFVMVTSDLDKLPRSPLSLCQKYHFPKIKEADVVQRLKTICIEEQLDFDTNALDFIAVKSNGSLRDAETMLEQLGLLGKKITLPLAYELVGVVSDDELLDLLDLALSPDTANTVRKARELMRSRVDPMQLVSQLANVIMDILAGRSRLSEVVADADMQKLRNALKILSEAEKQLRTSKNQATWVTVALLQFSGAGSSYPRMSDFQEDVFLGTNSSRGSLKDYICYGCNRNMSNCSGRYCDNAKFEAVWRKSIGKCPSNSFRNFLQKEGCLSSIYISEGMAIAEVEFHHPRQVIKAEKSWNIIASSLQQVLSCDVEIRFSLVPTYMRKRPTAKRPSFSLFSCSGRSNDVSNSTFADEVGAELSVGKERFVEAYIPNEVQQFSPSMQKSNAKQLTYTSSAFLHDETTPTRTIEVDARSTGTTISKRSVHDNPVNGSKLDADSSKELQEDCKHTILREPEIQPNCFAKTLRLQRRFLSSDVANTICLRVQPREFSIPRSASFDTYICKSEPYMFCSQSNERLMHSSGNENGKRKDLGLASKLLCWRTAKPFSKRPGVINSYRQQCLLNGLILHCMSFEKFNVYLKDVQDHGQAAVLELYWSILCRRELSVLTPSEDEFIRH